MINSTEAFPAIFVDIVVDDDDDDTAQTNTDESIQDCNVEPTFTDYLVKDTNEPIQVVRLLPTQHIDQQQQYQHQQQTEIPSQPSTSYKRWLLLTAVVLLVAWTATYSDSLSFPGDPRGSVHKIVNSWGDRFLQEQQQHGDQPHPALPSEETTVLPQLLPLSIRDLVGFGLASLGLIMAAGGGIGGGGMLVPIYILIFGLDARHAIPLSNVTVLGGAIANTFFFNVWKRHPHADRPLIDWDLILMMEPMTIAGALIGTKVNKLLPEHIIVILLFIILSLTARKTLRKARDMYEREQYDAVDTSPNEDDSFDGEHDDEATALESGTAQDNKEVNDLETSIELPVIPRIPRRENSLLRRQSSSATTNSSTTATNTTIATSAVPSSWTNPRLNNSRRDRSVGNDSKASVPSLSNVSIESSPSAWDNSLTPTSDTGRLSVSIDTNAPTNNLYQVEKVLTDILDDERRIPKLNVAVIVILFMVVLILNLLKGGGAFDSPIGISCGSTAFWVTESAAFVVIVLVTLFCRSHLVSKAKQKQVCDYRYIDGDIRWTERTTLVYPLWCGAAGFVAGLFGIGGGIVKGPIMLALGVPPAVASATSACMILFTSFTATTSFAVYGLILPDYAVVCVVVGIVATTVGQTLMSFLLRKYNRDSYIAFCIGAVVALSAACMCIEAVITLSSGGTRHPAGLCSHHFE